MAKTLETATFGELLTQLVITGKLTPGDRIEFVEKLDYCDLMDANIYNSTGCLIDTIVIPY